MALFTAPRFHPVPVLAALVGAIWLAAPSSTAQAQPAKMTVLHIGSSGTLTDKDEKGALESLRDFIKEETGLDNDIAQQKDWQTLADKMARGELQLGVFQGYEFAWVQEKQPALKPLALAVAIHRYPVAYVVTRKDNPATNFAGLQGQSLSLPNAGLRYLDLFVERQCQAAGKDLKGFFSKVVPPKSMEDALDDVVDGLVQAAVVSQAALETFKHRKPGRFNRLKEIAHSAPFPPTLVAYYDNALDAPTRQRFLDGLLNANQKERGRTLLTIFRLTRFEKVPADFDRVLAETRKTYPPPAKGTH